MYLKKNTYKKEVMSCMGSIGYLRQADDIVANSAQLLDDILSSNFNQFIQGLGQPVLVRYWNLNDTISTANSGTDTTDEDIGPESPNRYNQIDNLPLYGALRDLLPELVQNDNLLDIEINAEGVLLPDTIKPSTYDYFEYTFGKNKERSIIFKVNNITLSTIKNNGYYKIEFEMIDIDNSNQYRSRIERQVIKEFDVNLDTIGTNDKCILESKHLKFIQQIDAIIKDVLSQYTDLFYSEKYNAIVFQGLFEGDYLGYDPWLTKFLIQNNILSNNSDHPIVLVNYDEQTGFRPKYNMTFFHAIEIRSTKYLEELRYVPTPFSMVNANPFSFYGEEVAFKVDIFKQEHTKYTKNVYIPVSVLNNIQDNTKPPTLNELERLLIDFFNLDNLSNILDADIVKTLEQFNLEYTLYWFWFTPILVYILDAIKQDINNSYG